MKRTYIAVAVALVATVAGFWLYQWAKGEDGPVYRFAMVERGDIEATVSATGALQAVTTVEIGTQVSGQIAAIHADFNDRVTKGQLIARMDPTLQEQAVREAEASLERSRAELERAQREYERNKQLFERKVLTEVEFNTAKYSYEVARASLKSAEIALERARRNLGYTAIHSPIDGVVVERNVSVGQTVAASMSTPKLFLIANDLEQMQILASVDESDIGMIKTGQPVRFKVQAYPDDSFVGKVSQVRLQSTTQENVVNYTVVIDVENPTGRLLPGMTATVDFLTGSAMNALTVPNAALRFRPSPEMIAELRSARESKSPAASGSSDRERAGAGAGSSPRTRVVMGRAPNVAAGPGARAEDRPRDLATLWYLDANGKLAATQVRVGITDGQRTEITGPEIEEGMQVIVGLMQGGTQQSQSPFQPPQSGGRAVRMPVHF